MKKILAKTYSPLAYLLATAVLLLPLITYAKIEYDLPNFLTVGTIEELILAILRIIITVAVPIIILFIIYAGFLYVTARGNAEQTQKATRALTYSIIGGTCRSV